MCSLSLYLIWKVCFILFLFQFMFLFVGLILLYGRGVIGSCYYYVLRFTPWLVSLWYIFDWRFVLISYQSVHEGRIYQLKLFCDKDYPEKPPSVRFHTRISMTCVNPESGVVIFSDFCLMDVNCFLIYCSHFYSLVLVHLWWIYIFFTVTMSCVYCKSYNKSLYFIVKNSIVAHKQ